jgi:sensor histidine kinase YesM
LAFAFYVDFARVLISTREKLPKWDRYLEIEKFILILFAVTIPFVNSLLGKEIYQIVVFVFSVMVSCFSIFAYCSICKIKGRNVEYFIIGSISFLILGNVSTFYKFLIVYLGVAPPSFEPMIFTYLGVLVEALVFTYIMGRIFKEIEAKKIAFRLQFALKQQEAAELKMAALQSQMNPHFLFNSLNSINNFVLKNNIEEASDYITSFSKLIRKILANSERTQISLAEELEVLKIYVDLESTRVIGGFDYIQSIDKSLRLNEIQVPPLFLQPFIENSIWHGLVDKKGEKSIQISIEKKGNYIEAVIKDNGIGLKSSLLQNEKLKYKRKFFGISATEKRIKLLYNSEGVEINISDLSEMGESGTMVKLSFPCVVSKSKKLT